jgi:biopolymer transport protein ExbD
MRALRRGRQRHGGIKGGHGMPALIPMIDMLTIMVVYLLVHSADYEILPNTKNISIPQSVSEARPRDSVTVMVTRDMVFVNGAATTRVVDLKSGDAIVDSRLQAALVQASKARRVMPGKAAEPPELTLLADKELPYSVLKRIMMTCTAAKYGKLSLAVIEKERAYTPIGT